MLAAETGAAANIKDHGRGGKGEELQSALCHSGLNRFDSRGGSVFIRFRVIVEEVWGTVAVLVGAYRANCEEVGSLQGIFGTGHGGDKMMF